MPGAGTDRTRDWISGGPIIVLVEPQLGENIGAAARAMANFGLSRLRLVKPRDGWPNPQAQRSASGADRVLDEAQLFDNVAAAIADCSFVVATTARAHDQAKPVTAADAGVTEMADRIAGGQTVAVLFGRERNGLENDEIALADKIVTLPVNPAFASLNLAQAVLVIAYEWSRCVTGTALPFSMPQKSAPAPRAQLFAFFENLERALEKVEFFRPPEKRETMLINLRNIIHRMQPTQQDIQTLHGVVVALAEGRKGPASGGVLDGAEAELLRELLAEHGAGKIPSERTPVRGLARLLRRNPTDAERRLWDALVKDRRFAGLFKRQVPVGPHIVDFVSFPLRAVIDLVPESERPPAARTRAEKRSWLDQRGYRVLEVREVEVLRDLSGLLGRLAHGLERRADSKR
jgi:tRNA/rRNA methyltransferase